MSKKVEKKGVERIKYNILVRRRRLVGLLAQGLNIGEIADKLGVNIKTIERDMTSKDIAILVDELFQQQLKDISESSPKTRLEYRDRLLSKLMPKRVESKVEGGLIVRGFGLEVRKDVKSEK